MPSARKKRDSLWCLPLSEAALAACSFISFVEKKERGTSMSIFHIFDGDEGENIVYYMVQHLESHHKIAVLLIIYLL